MSTPGSPNPASPIPLIGVIVTLSRKGVLAIEDRIVRNVADQENLAQLTFEIKEGKRYLPASVSKGYKLEKMDGERPSRDNRYQYVASLWTLGDRDTAIEQLKAAIETAVEADIQQLMRLRDAVQASRQASTNDDSSPLPGPAQ